MTTTPYHPDDIAAAIARALAAANDRPNPTFDANRPAQEYAAMAQDFRASAWEHLEQGDMDQASNKAWGLVAETVKAVSAQHGGIIHTHRAIWRAASELGRLAGDAGDTPTRDWIRISFMVARGLHTNFYENEAPADDIRTGLLQCEALSQRLYQLFWPEGTPAPTDPSQ